VQDLSTSVTFFLCVCRKTNLDKIRDNASSIVNHSESTIEMQRTVVLPDHFTGGSLSHLGDSSWMDIEEVGHRVAYLRKKTIWKSKNNRNYREYLSNIYGFVS